MMQLRVCRASRALLSSLVVASAALVPAALVAQDSAPRVERTDVQLRNDCRLALQVLATGHPQPQHAWAMEQVRRCDESGGAAVALLWARAADDAASLEALEALVRASVALGDARVLEATLAAAGDAGRPLAVRLAALRVLPVLLLPNLELDAELLADPPSLAILPVRTHYVRLEGSQPLPASARAQVMTLLGELRVDGSPAIRRAATWLQRGLIVRFASLEAQQ